MALTYIRTETHHRRHPRGFDIRIVAGAGSGKTFTMTQRILHLLREGKDDGGRPVDPARSSASPSPQGGGRA